jgi:hypothetical protein
VIVRRPVIWRRGAAACALAVLLAGGAARADDVGLVVVAAGGAPAPVSEVTAAMVEGGVAAGHAVVRDAAGVAARAQAAGAVPRAALERFRRVRDLVDEGWRAYLQVAGDFAAARLGRARGDAEALLGLDGGVELYADVALRLGAVLDHLGRRAESADVLRLAGWLDPGRAVTTAEFSPDVVAAFDAARARTPAPVTVRVLVPGTAAMIEIDGRSAGPAPLTVELAAGQHVAVARAAGHLARGVAFAAVAGGEVVIGLEADPAAVALRGGVAAGAGEAAAGRAIEAVERFADADAVVLAAAVWRQGEPALLGQWCAGGRCTAVVEVGYGAAPGGLAAAAGALWRELAAVAAERRYPPTLPSDPRLGRGVGPSRLAGARCRWCRSPWLWAGLGAAAVAVGAGVAVLASGDDGTIVAVDPDDFRSLAAP